MLISAAQTISSTPLAVLRIFEVGAIVIWALGFSLAYRYGPSKFLFGIYLGTTCWFMWDWIFTDNWFLNLRYDSRSLMLYTLDGRPEPLWSPMSYGFFFGIAALVYLRYQWKLRKWLGNAMYIAFPIGMALLDLLVEGFVVSTLDIYSYGYRDEWKILGIPYTNLVWVVIIQSTMIITCSAFVRFQHSRGVLAVKGDPNFPPEHPDTSDPSGKPAEGWLIAALTFSVTMAAVYIGTTVMSFVLAWIDPWVK